MTTERTFTNWQADAESLLRGDDVRPHSTTSLIALALAATGLYGAVMGSFGGVSDERVWQVFFSAIKTPFLYVAIYALPFPVFYVAMLLAGLGMDVGRVSVAILRSQASFSIILLSLAPLTALWYLSVTSYRLAVLFNGAMFFVALNGAQVVLRREYAPLIRRNRRHWTLLIMWFLVTAFVGIQAAWTMRPFIGHPQGTPVFLRGESVTNAYTHVAHLIYHALLP